jgi:Tol biopolymer transport system component
VALAERTKVVAPLVGLGVAVTAETVGVVLSTSSTVEPEAPDLVAGDTNQVADVFVRDTCRTVAGPVADCRPSVRRVSTTAAGAQGDQPSRHPFISGDGSYVVFATRANLDPRRDANDATRRWDIYRADRRTGQVRLVNAAGRLSHGLYVSPPSPVASHDGRFVAWTVPSDPRELLLRDMELDSLEVVAHGVVGKPAVSDDGRFLAFATIQAYDGADANGAADVYLLDRGTSSFTRITDAAGAGSVRGDLGIGMSGDGKVVAYVTRDGMVDSSGISDTNGSLDVYVHDRRAARHRVHLVSASFARTASRSPAAGAARPVVSADGRAVAFESTAGDLVSPAAGAAGHPADGASAGVFVRDLDAGRTRRVSAGACREAGGQPAPAGLALSGDGALVAFLSPAQEHGGDGGSGFDVFATR